MKFHTPKWKRRRKVLSLILCSMIVGCNNYSTPKDDRDNYRDIELLDSLRLSSNKILYCYRYSHFRSVADEVYYSITNSICKIDSGDAILMTPSESFLNGVSNDSVNIILTGKAFEERSKRTSIKFRFLKYQYGQKYKEHRYLAIMKSERCN